MVCGRIKYKAVVGWRGHAARGWGGRALTARARAGSWSCQPAGTSGYSHLLSYFTPHTSQSHLFYCIKLTRRIAVQTCA